MTPTPQQRAIQASRRYAAEQPLFLDTETTGTGPRAEIIEVALIDAEGGVLLNTLVRPTRPIPADAAAIHGISNNLVGDAPAWAEVWPELQRLTSGRLVGIYNAEFDVRLLRQTHAAHRLAGAADLRAFCIMLLYAEYRGQRGAYGGYRWHKLADAGRYCRLPLPHAHRALDDTLLARAVFYHMAAAGQA
jgi:DNA polymerase III epsilon subunit-like protein